MTVSKLRLGTRGSKLALTQALATGDMLSRRYPGLRVQIVKIATSGDQGDRDVRGAFVREIQLALLERKIDAGLHCLKDLPTEPVEGLTLVSFVEREDPRDALIARVESIIDLPRGAVVGTGSVRRTSQVAFQRPDVSFRPLVGNVDTRLRKLMSGEYDAIILALAGLKRLNLLDAWQSSEYGSTSVTAISTQDMLPAPGQATLVLEARSDDRAVNEILSPFDHFETRQSTTAERALLAAFGGCCSVPVAALARCDGERLFLDALVASLDGQTVIRGTDQGLTNDPVDVASRLYKKLCVRGAAKVLRQPAVTS